ncbi:hypothetical protein [Legionella shakespearei]|uniref:Uncharacterized protein n=1 Tax=Legionella shakespearei DSM 23087 TaxID=1122169 RepID=A0A0W0YZT4_9GAMM|nr:hypothetical protein [Legionella shakespearei]KTD62397.1 hypothetical protein Lsha_1097 [Legionella shakespearei DSM 23087]
MKVTCFDNRPEIIQICADYWEIDNNGEFLHNTSAIGKKYGLSANKITQIAKEYSCAYSSTLYCSSCSIPYQYVNRTDYQSTTEINCWTCNDCLANEKMLLNEKKQIVLSHEFTKQQENHPLSIERLNVRLSILLLSLIRYGANEDLTFINEYLTNRTDRLSPDDDDDIDFIRELYRGGCISIAPFSHPDTLTLAEDNNFSFYPKSVKWLLPLSEGQTFREFIMLLEAKLASTDYLEASYDEVLDFCKDISLKECLAYLKYKMDEHKLPFTPGDKTRLVLSKALEMYSVAQVYGFIWTAVSSTAAYYMRTQGSISKKQAANAVVGNIEKNFERAYTQNWDVKGYRRDHNLPQSIISRILFNVLLHTDDGGFYLPLGKIMNLEDTLST